VHAKHVIHGMPFSFDPISFYHGLSLFSREAMGLSLFLTTFYFREKFFRLKNLRILKIRLTCSSKEFD